jgi:hypothetical protein
MGLFTRRRAVAEARWLPSAQEILTAPADVMEGECAGAQAYGIQFGHEDAPGAVITIWAFAAECGAAGPGDFWVAYRADYMILDAGGDAAWSDAIYCGDADFSEWYPDPEGADEGARQSASDLLGGADTAALQVPASTVTEWFDWDGQPW